MRRHHVVVIASLCGLWPAAIHADELPTRKAGLWELKMAIEGVNMSITGIRQCTDASTDKEMMGNFDSSGIASCPERHIKNEGGTVTVDSTCQMGPSTVTSHAVITGNFDSAYTIKVESKHAGGPPLPHVGPGGVSRMTMEAKWIGPCEKGQKPGDIIMPGGITINVKQLHFRRDGQ